MSPILSVRNVSHAYRDARALDSVSIDVSEGEFLGILGPNGSGKSTLLKILSGILKPASGEVILDEKRIGDWTMKARARVLAYVPQTMPYEFPFTVFEFVWMGRAPHLSFFGGSNPPDDPAVRAALVKSDCETIASRPVTMLSGGERQRAILAQAFAQEARLYILDEPVSHLDIGHQLQVLEVLKKETQAGKTVIASFHELNLAARFSTRLLLLSRGRIAARGLPGEVLESGILRSVYGVSARVLPDPGTGAPIIVADQSIPREAGEPA